MVRRDDVHHRLATARSLNFLSFSRKHLASVRCSSAVVFYWLENQEYTCHRSWRSRSIDKTGR